MAPENIKKNIRDLRKILTKQTVLFSEADEYSYAQKPFPDKWSRKEILGHLIDSAGNNLQRFIRTQYEDEPSIIYDQDTWVRLNNYQEATLSKLIDLWRLLNEQILRIIESTPPENFKKKCLVKDKARTMEWLFEDYIRHMQHHLYQINKAGDSE